MGFEDNETALFLELSGGNTVFCFIIFEVVQVSYTLIYTFYKK